MKYGACLLHCFECIQVINSTSNVCSDEDDNIIIVIFLAIIIIVIVITMLPLSS